MKINQKVAYKKKGKIIKGKIVAFELGDIVGSTNKYPGLRPQQNAIVETESGEIVKIDRHYLTQKESGLTKEEWEENTKY